MAQLLKGVSSLTIGDLPAAAPKKNKLSGVEILDEIKTHEFLYKKSSVDVQAFTKMLDTLRRDESFTDVTVYVKGEPFPCHKVVLAASSDYFRALFVHAEEKSTSKSIVLDSISPNGFQHLLRFMYTHELVIDLENILDVLEAADFLQFRPVVEKCSSMLLQHITVSNCLALHQIGESHLCGALADTAYNFILGNFEEVSQSKEFLHLGKGSLEAYMRDECVQIKDVAKLLESLCKWIAFDVETRKSGLLELVQYIDLPSIDRYKFNEVTSAEANIKPLFKDIIKEHEDLGDGGLVPTKSLLKKRPTEVLSIVPRETTASTDGKRKKDILYYCVKETKWKVLTEIPFNDRIAYDVAVLHNEIYFTGGIEYNLALDEVMAYSVKADDWRKLPPMVKCRSHHSSAAMAGKVYVVGGRNQEEARWESRTITLRNDAEEYDPKSQQWTLLAQQIGMSGIGRAAVVPLDDRLFVIGGTMGNEDTKQSSSRKVHMGAMYYDIHRKLWHNLDISEALENMKIAVSVGDCLAYEGCILLIDEDLRGKRMAVFNPVSEQLHTFIRTHGTHRFGGYQIQGNTLYLTGGVAGIFKTHDLVHYQDLTDPEGTWHMLTPLPDSYSHHACVSVFKVL